jgi:hypothetical protein
LEIDNGQAHLYAASIYLDYNDPIENNIKTIEKMLKLHAFFFITIEVSGQLHI